MCLDEGTFPGLDREAQQLFGRRVRKCSKQYLLERVASTPGEEFPPAGEERRFRGRRRLKKIGAQQASIGWRTIIGKISASVDWRD